MLYFDWRVQGILNMVKKEKAGINKKTLSLRPFLTNLKLILIEQRAIVEEMHYFGMPLTDIYNELTIFRVKYSMLFT
jgi:hypothetical protein